MVAIALKTSTGRLTLIESPYFVVVQFEAMFGPLKFKSRLTKEKNSSEEIGSLTSPRIVHAGYGMKQEIIFSYGMIRAFIYSLNCYRYLP